MATSHNEMIEMATARANVYGLLATIFRQEPSPALLASLRADEFSTALKALSLSPDEPFGSGSGSGSDKQLAEELALEYTQLFIGPGPHLSPHESLHVEARFGEENVLWGPSTVAVKKFMQGAGVSVDESFDGMPDHISAEFEFMQQLLQQEAMAWRNEEDELAANILNVQKRFYDEHLSRWVGRFCDKCIEAARHGFYRQLSKVTQGFTLFEEETLKELVAKADQGQPVLVRSSF